MVKVLVLVEMRWIRRKAKEAASRGEHVHKGRDWSPKAKSFAAIFWIILENVFVAWKA